MTAVRSLPLRVQPISGEALDSWLEALAHRNETRFSDLLSAVGIQQDFRIPQYTTWLVTLTESELDALTAATGLHWDGLRAMTLSRFANVLDVSPMSRRVLRSSPATGWRAATQSRFCPRCLETNKGRWKSAWRLGWFSPAQSIAAYLPRRVHAAGDPNGGWYTRVGWYGNVRQPHGNDR
jgi:hypothetical protein